MKQDLYFSRKNTCVSFTLSIFVLYIHANNLNYYAENIVLSKTIETFIGGRIGDIIVPTFFMISGFLFYRNINVQSNCKEIISSKLKKRFHSLVIPYLLWNTFGTFFYMVIPWVPKIGTMISGGAASVTLSNILEGIFHFKYYFPLWYLFYLIILVYIAPILVWLLKNKKMSVVVLSLLAMGYLLKLELPILSCGSLFFYILGAYLAVYNKEFWMKKEENSRAFVYLCLLFFMILFRFFYVENIVGRLLYLISPVFLWKSFDVLSYKTKPSEFMGQSFFIYCAHIIPLTMINKIFVKLFDKMPSDFSAVISYMMSPLCALALLFVIYLLLVTYCKKIFILVSGGRI